MCPTLTCLLRSAVVLLILLAALPAHAAAATAKAAKQSKHSQAQYCQGFDQSPHKVLALVIGKQPFGADDTATLRARWQTIQHYLAPTTGKPRSLCNYFSR